MASFTTPNTSASLQEVYPQTASAREYGVLGDNPTPDVVIYGKGYITTVYNPQKEKLHLVDNSARVGVLPSNREQRRKQARMARRKAAA